MTCRVSSCCHHHMKSPGGPPDLLCGHWISGHELQPLLLCRGWNQTALLGPSAGRHAARSRDGTAQPRSQLRCPGPIAAPHPGANPAPTLGHAGKRSSPPAAAVPGSEAAEGAKPQPAYLPQALRPLHPLPCPR